MKKIKNVYPKENYIVICEFEDGLKKKYDFKLLMKEYKSFKKLEKEIGLFEKLKLIMEDMEFLGMKSLIYRLKKF